MSSDVALAVNDLAKAYTIRHNVTDHITLAELALDRIRHPFHRAEREQFWALDGVDFELREGEVLGLIGRNGAGKSTLLKVLARITDPTRGEVRLWGRVGSLLEVGTGFHAELTGRENIYLNGSILGMGRKEIASKFDAIVDFAGVESFLDTPVKRYSSGMYVRLAFAVAAHLDTEILLLDEVLAVGDGDFQAKCLGKVAELARSGRAVMLVSHNMVTVRQFASRAILLERGALVREGPVGDVIGYYTDVSTGVLEEADVSSTPRYDPNLGRRARITMVRLQHDQGVVGADADLEYVVTVQSNEDVSAVRLSQTIYTVAGIPVGNSIGNADLELRSGHEVDLHASLPGHGLAPGRYYLALGLGFGDTSSGMIDLDVVLDTVHFEVLPAVSADGRLTTWNDSWGHVRFPPVQVTQGASVYSG